MGLVLCEMLWCYCFTDFVKSLYFYCQNGGKTTKTLGCSWTNKITRHFPIGLKSFSPQMSKQNPRPHLLTFGYY